MSFWFQYYGFQLFVQNTWCTYYIFLILGSVKTFFILLISINNFNVFYNIQSDTCTWIKQQRNKNTKFPFYFNFCINQDSSSVKYFKNYYLSRSLTPPQWPCKRLKYQQIYKIYYRNSLLHYFAILHYK